MQADQQTIQRLETLSTEQRNPASMSLSSWTTLELLRCINEQDQMVAHQVARVLPDIAKAVEIISERMERGGRLVYVGTGTSGRLGYMDAAECPPTYGCGEDAVTCVMAGGRDAVFHAQEALEDHGEIARSDLEKWGLKAEDTVVAASASGRTPYCVSALDYALSLGCGRVALGMQPRLGNGASCGCCHRSGHGPRSHHGLHADEGGHGAEDGHEHAFHRRHGAHGAYL